MNIMRLPVCAFTALGSIAIFVSSAAADVFHFSTGNPDGLMATASQPGVGGKIEIESADDFVLTQTTLITSGTFTGLIVPPATGGSPTIGEVVTEIYRVFPQDSGPFDGLVPTRTNSPSDVAFDTRNSTVPNLSFTTTTLNTSFIAANSVLNGINKSLTPATGGEGAVTGQEVRFNLAFTTPFELPAGHYFFVPQVQITNGEFFWLSAPKPIVAPGTPFPAGFTDLQEWIRNANLDPDWLRVGTDIVGSVNGATAPQFNATFSLDGETVPEPGSMTLLGFGALGLIMRGRRVFAARR
jgi:hypothetical protein